MGFQIIFSLLIIFAVLRSIDQFRRKRIRPFFFFFFLVVWCLVFFLNWNNPLLNRIGHQLGIERGATILVYLALFLLFYYAAISISNFYKIERDIRQLIKKNSIEDFLKKYNEK